MNQADDQSPSDSNAFSVHHKKRTVSLPTFTLSLLSVFIVGFILGTRADSLSLPFGSDKGEVSNLDLSPVQSTYDVLREKYAGELDTEKLIEGAQRGLVAASGDPYTTYFSEEEAKAFFGDLEGKFSGIGAELDKRGEKLSIVSTIDGSPARQAGLMPNDVIVAVNDEETAGWSIEQAVSRIRGEKGTTVKLTILRDGQELKDVSIVRDQITNPSVKTEITADNVGVLRISRFGENETYDLAKRAAEEFKQKGVERVVVDLRGNGGGYLFAAQQIAGLWLEDKVVVTERRDGKIIETLRTDSNAPLKGIPTVVLMDGGSASASEILAGALKDNGAATLVGQKTFGKGSVQQVETLPGGGQLKVTVAKWFTPKGRNISKEGIVPDVEVGFSKEDQAANRDPQLDKALETVKTLPKQ